jgi:hypothetical protein
VIRTVCVALLTLSVTAGLAFAADDETDLSGLYLCEGQNPEGKGYQAIVQIVKHHDTYQVRWTFSGDGATAVGVGIRSGEVLAVSYVAQDIGLVAYHIETGRLVGRWTMPGADGAVFSETLTRTKAIEFQHPPTPDAPKPDAAPAGGRIRVAWVR